jgi:hypothetical protein
MTTTYVSVQMIVNGKPFVFTKDATDGSANEELTNIVSGLGIGDTFSAGGRISSLMPATLNSSDGTGASKSVIGVELVDPQNNVVTFIPWVDPETAPIGRPWMCNFPVGLNYKLQVTTSNT